MRQNFLFAVFVFVIAALSLPLTVKAQVSSGGAYALDQVVIAGGGGSSSGGAYAVDGTAGQAAIGNSNGPQYSMRGGFWVQAPLAPTAANARIDGRVVRDNGIGLKAVQVVLAGGRLTSPRIALTNNTGYFFFEDVEVGASYSVSVSSKKYGFADGTRVFTLMDSISDLEFQASWENP